MPEEQAPLKPRRPPYLVLGVAVREQLQAVLYLSRPAVVLDWVFTVSKLIMLSDRLYMAKYTTDYLQARRQNVSACKWSQLKHISHERKFEARRRQNATICSWSSKFPMYRILFSLWRSWEYESSVRSNYPYYAGCTVNGCAAAPSIHDRRIRSSNSLVEARASQTARLGRVKVEACLKRTDVSGDRGKE